MKQRRTGNQSGWDGVPKHRRNPFQRVAAGTKGIITPGNIISVTGAAVVYSGIKDIEKGGALKGVLKIMAGRTADLADGKVSRLTGTTSTIGEFVDATTDKLLLARTMWSLAKQGVVPQDYAAQVLVQQGTNVTATGTAFVLNNEIHPSAEGKHGMFMIWSALGSYCAAQVAENRGWSLGAERMRQSADFMAAASLRLGEVATPGYIQDALGFGAHPGASR